MTTTPTVPKPRPDKQRVLSNYARRTGWSKVDGLSPSPKYLAYLKTGVAVDDKGYHFWNDYNPAEYEDQ